jgi:hypothetical protein
MGIIDLVVVRTTQVEVAQVEAGLGQAGRRNLDAG